MKTASSISFLLRQKLDEIRSRNGAYSLRAFAKKLDIHPAALSEVLNQKRRVSTKLAKRLADNMDLNEKEREQFFALSAQGKVLKKLEKKQLAETTTLEMDQYFLVSEWYYYAILSLAETKGFQATPHFIGRRLGLPLETASQALNRLVRLGYFQEVKKNRKKTLVLKPNLRLSTSEDIVSAALKRRHVSNLQAAQEAIRTVPVELREFTFITMAIDPSKLQEAKPILREFREKLCAFMEDGKQTEVYEFCLSLFPRTLPNTGETK